jgi:Ca2+-binding RTX toxin-like protein
VLTGTAYADRIEGGGGADLLIGGVGNDSMNGGAGSDLYLIALASDHLAAEIADTGNAGVDEASFHGHQRRYVEAVRRRHGPGTGGPWHRH